MSTYIFLINLSESSRAPTTSAHEKQRQAIEDAFAKAGGKLQSLTWTLGQYDLIAQVEVDADALNKERTSGGHQPLTTHEVAAGFAHWLQRTLHVRTETLVGLDDDGMNAAGWVSERCGG